ncbi:MAG: S8 family serine peptidase, partial [Nitrososphaerota archaeon]
GSVDGPVLGTAVADGNGDWEITLNASNANLGAGESGEFTLVAKAELDGEEDVVSAPVTLTIDCPEAPTTIDEPADGTTIDCEEALTVSGTFDSSAFIEVEIFVDGNSVGFAELDGDNWSFEVPANLLTEGSHTIVAIASTGESEPNTSESNSITVTAECPPPPDGGGGGGGTGGGAGGAGGGGGAGGAAGSAVTNVQRSIFRVPYTEIECVQSVVELREDLIPTTDFPAVVEEVKSQFNLTVLNVWNVPEYKAMLLAEGDEEKLSDDDRFLPAETTCGEIILEAVLPANIQDLAQDVISQYHVKVVDIIDMPEYKAIVILAEPDNLITKDPRFINYNEDYQLSENYTGSGELNLKYGHIAAPPTVIEEEITPDSIRRTFSAEELNEDDTQSEDGEEAEVDVDIAILDTGIDLDHPDLNVYKDFSVIGINQTGDDDQGHGTHVAGVAAAKDNGIGVIGGAPGARLWSVKVCDSEGKCKISDMIKGVQYVTEHADEIDVANISVETPLSPALNRAISASIKAGVTFVVAAGNYGQDASLTSPASSPDVITVSAIADTDGKCGGVGPAPDLANSTDDAFAPFSNFGPSVSIAAPGVSVLSTYLDGEYAVDSGTSMASPSVAAAAALIKANSTDMTPKEVKDNLVNTGSTPLTPCQDGPQGYFSGDPDNQKEPLLFRK